MIKTSNFTSLTAEFVFRFQNPQIHENGGEGEEHTRYHSELHSKLLGGNAEPVCQRHDACACGYRVGDDTDELRTDGCAEV